MTYLKCKIKKEDKDSVLQRELIIKRVYVYKYVVVVWWWMMDKCFLFGLGHLSSVGADLSEGGGGVAAAAAAAGLLREKLSAGNRRPVPISSISSMTVAPRRRRPTHPLSVVDVVILLHQLLYVDHLQMELFKVPVLLLKLLVVHRIVLLHNLRFQFLRAIKTQCITTSMCNCVYTTTVDSTVLMISPCRRLSLFCVFEADGSVERTWFPVH